MSSRSPEMEREMAAATYWRLADLLGPATYWRSRVVLNPSEEIRGKFFQEYPDRGVLCEFYREGKPIMDFRLLETGLTYIGAKGFGIVLGDSVIGTDTFFRLDEKDIPLKDRWILPHLADHVVELVARSIQEGKIPGLTFQVQLAPGTIVS